MAALVAVHENGDDDAKVHGSHTATISKNTLVYVSQSKITGAGRGVFANTKLVEKQIVTWYDGECHPDRVLGQYTIAIKQKKSKDGNDNTPSYLYLCGLTEPQLGRGLGSFINRTPRGRRANCVFDVDSDNKTVWITACKNIRQGTELVATYGHTFRIPSSV